MGVPLVGQFMLDKEAQAEIEKLEQLKRLGRNFIRVVYTGRNQMPRYHGFHGVGIVSEFDAEQGQDVPRAVPEDRVVEFRRGADGRFVADILDDEMQENRYAISRHLGMDMEVEDPQLAKEIAALVDKPYDPEPDRRTQLLREKARIEAELATMGGGFRRGRRKRMVGTMAPEAVPPVEDAGSAEEGSSSG